MLTKSARPNPAQGMLGQLEARDVAGVLWALVNLRLRPGEAWMDAYMDGA